MKHINDFNSFLNETENITQKNGPREMTVHFYECEHDGDLDNYASDLRDSGAEILSTSCNSEAETGAIKIRVKDFDSFLTKFKETDSIGFSSLDNE